MGEKNVDNGVGRVVGVQIRKVSIEVIEDIATIAVILRVRASHPFINKNVVPFTPH